MNDTSEFAALTAWQQMVRPIVDATEVDFEVDFDVLFSRRERGRKLHRHRTAGVALMCRPARRASDLVDVVVSGTSVRYGDVCCACFPDQVADLFEYIADRYELLPVMSVRQLVTWMPNLAADASNDTMLQFAHAASQLRRIVDQVPFDSELSELVAALRALTDVAAFDDVDRAVAAWTPLLATRADFEGMWLFDVDDVDEFEHVCELVADTCSTSFEAALADVFAEVADRVFPDGDMEAANRWLSRLPFEVFAEVVPDPSRPVVGQLTASEVAGRLRCLAVAHDVSLFAQRVRSRFAEWLSSPLCVAAFGALAYHGPTVKMMERVSFRAAGAAAAGSKDLGWTWMVGPRCMVEASYGGLVEGRAAGRKLDAVFVDAAGVDRAELVELLCALDIGSDDVEGWLSSAVTLARSARSSV